MKKTCGQCKHRWMECCLKDKRERLTVDAADEACESFELHLGTVDEAFEASLAKAREKHPDFVPMPTPDLAEGFAVDARWHAEAVPYLRNVLLSEVQEFLAEVAKGDFGRALEEAGDVMAVLYRALNGEGKKAVSHE